MLAVIDHLKLHAVLAAGDMLRAIVGIFIFDCIVEDFLLAARVFLERVITVQDQRTVLTQALRHAETRFADTLLRTQRLHMGRAHHGHDGHLRLHHPGDHARQAIGRCFRDLLHIRAIFRRQLLNEFRRKIALFAL